MDVNPTAPAAPAPAIAATPGRTSVATGRSNNVQAVSPDNVQDGARFSTMAPGPLEGPAAAGQPATQPNAAGQPATPGGTAQPATPAGTAQSATPAITAQPATTTAAPTAPATVTTASPAAPAIATTGAPPPAGGTVPTTLPTTGAPPPPASTTTTLANPALANPALVAPAPAAAQAEPVNIDHPTVVDTANLKAGSTVVSLYGIEGLQGDAAQSLQSYLGGTDSRLTCQAQPGTNYVCLLPDGTDVAEVALVNGAARAKDDAPDAYRDQEAAAQAARRGIWADLPPPPATIQHPIVQDTATLVAGGQTYVLNGIIGFGQPYAAQLQGYIAANGDSLTCLPQIEPGEYICMTSDGTDIAKVALVNGAARVDSDAPDTYRNQQMDALNNRRGFWLNPPQDVLLAATAVQTVPLCCAFVPGDDGSDGITYVGGEPEAIIDGSPEFLVYGGDAGWGYYDHYHHWRGAPDRFRHHLERYHPGGHGLRGYGHEASLRHDVAMHREEGLRREDGLRREAAAHPGGMRPGMGGPGGHPGYAGAGGRPGFEGGHPGYAGAGGRPGFEGGHPGYAGGGARPGFAGAAAHPGFAGGGARPGFGGGRPGFAGGGGGFVHPGPSMGGFHPGGGGGGFHPGGGGGGGHAAPHGGGGGGGKHH